MSKTPSIIKLLKTLILFKCHKHTQELLSNSNASSDPYSLSLTKSELSLFFGPIQLCKMGRRDGKGLTKSQLMPEFVGKPEQEQPGNRKKKGVSKT